jgi:hypothetical protein
MLILFIGHWEILVLLLIFLLKIVALVDILSSRYPMTEKLIWVIVIILLNVIGVVLYYFIGKRKQKH